MRASISALLLQGRIDNLTGDSARRFSPPVISSALWIAFSQQKPMILQGNANARYRLSVTQDMVETNYSDTKKECSLSVPPLDFFVYWIRRLCLDLWGVNLEG
jgi:hypothetical protein